MNKRRWLNARAIGLLAAAVVCFGLCFGLCFGMLRAGAQQAQNPQPAQPPRKTQQKPGDKSKPGNEQDKSNPEQLQQITVNVRLPVTVTDSKTGRFIVDLKQSDFEVYEDKTAQEIEGFTPQS